LADTDVLLNVRFAQPAKPDLPPPIGAFDPMQTFVSITAVII
jgi:hypothetical protein